MHRLVRQYHNFHYNKLKYQSDIELKWKHNETLITTNKLPSPTSSYNGNEEFSHKNQTFILSPNENTVIWFLPSTQI